VVTKIKVIARSRSSWNFRRIRNYVPVAAFYDLRWFDVITIMLYHNLSGIESTRAIARQSFPCLRNLALKLTGQQWRTIELRFDFELIKAELSIGDSYFECWIWNGVGLC
jgi:hypothetical protein